MTDTPKTGKRAPTRTSWTKGISGNPLGRPRHGLAFAERVRERLNPDTVIDLAMKVAEDETLSPAERLVALWPLVDRGVIKPPAGLDVAVTNGNATSGYDLGALSTDEKRDLLAKLRSLPRLAAGDAPPTEGQGEP